MAATIMIVLAPSSAQWTVPIAAFAGSVGGVALTWVLGRSAGAGTATLLLAGIVVSAFLTATQTFVQQLDTQTIKQVYIWMLGGLGTAGWPDVVRILPYVLISGVLLCLGSRLLDVLTLGDEEAAALGIHPAAVRFGVLGAACVATAAAVSAAGLIGFVGIIVPHAVRLLVGSSYRILIPLSLVGGAAFLVAADMLARTVLAPAELPIGVVTACVGAPFFLVILRRRSA
jgi:iron complex transport system permease protein